MFSRYHLPISLSLGAFLAPGAPGPIDLGLDLDLGRSPLLPLCLESSLGGADLLGADPGLDESLLSLDLALLKEEDDESLLHLLLLALLN